MQRKRSRLTGVFLVILALMLQIITTNAFAEDNIALQSTQLAARAICEHAINAIDYDGANRLTVHFKTTPPTVCGRYRFWLTDKNGSTIYFKAIDKTDGYTWSIELYNALIEGRYTLHFKSNDPAYGFTISAQEPASTARPTERPTQTPAALPTEVPTVEPTTQPTAEPPLLASVRFETNNIEIMTRESDAVAIHGIDQYGNAFDLSGTGLLFEVQRVDDDSDMLLSENQTFQRDDMLFSIYRINGKPRLMALAGINAQPGTWQITVHTESGLADTLQMRIVENPNPIVWPTVTTAAPTSTPLSEPTAVPEPTAAPTAPPTSPGE